VLLVITTVALLRRKRAGLVVVAVGQVLGTGYACAAVVLGDQVPRDDWLSHAAFSRALDELSVLVGLVVLV
jgi:hypothetical protein